MKNYTILVCVSALLITSSVESRPYRYHRENKEVKEETLPPKCCLKNKVRYRQATDVPKIVAQNKKWGVYLEQKTTRKMQATVIKQDVYIPQKEFVKKYNEKNFRFLSTDFLYSETTHEVIIRSVDGRKWYKFKKAGLTSFALAPTQGYLITQYDNKLIIWSHSKNKHGQPKAEIYGVDHYLNGQHKEDETLLIVFMKNGDGELWNLRTGKPVASIESLKTKLA